MYDFYANEMKVRFAVQILSTSIVDAIGFLQSEGVVEFQESDGTTIFIRKIDMIFDLLSSQNPCVLEPKNES